jgi:hypothetical protein
MSYRLQFKQSSFSLCSLFNTQLGRYDKQHIIALTVHLVSGANRGIDMRHRSSRPGWALVRHLVMGEQVIVFASVRYLVSPTALNELAEQH